MQTTDGLNDVQKQAVLTTSGPLLILAGAGSGKTKTLTHRIAHLIATKAAWPEQILAVTFTNKAAREMRERLSDLLNQQNDRNFMPWMGTFHGICVRLLKIDGSEIGLAKNFVIFDEDDRQSLVKQAMKELGISDKQAKPRAISSAISSAKNQMQYPDDVARNANYPFERLTAEVYSVYERLKKQAYGLDFDDLLLETVRLLSTKPSIRDKWRSKFKHILIDEYQDTNSAQYQIVKYLVGDDHNICVVGDDWQSIYSWRGADFTNILNFERDFPGANVVKLEQNYRSTGAILEAAQNVISKNITRTDKKIWTAEGSGEPVQINQAYDETEESYLIAQRISTHIAVGARQAKDFAVLYRTNAMSYSLERAFLQFHVPYKIIGGVRFYDRREIKDIVAYLRLLHQPNDRVSFSRIANIPTRGVGATSLAKFLNWQASQSVDVISAMVQVESSPVTGRARAALSSLGEGFRKLQVLLEKNSNPSFIIEEVIKHINYYDFIRDGTPQAEERLENISSLVSDAASFASLADFLDEVALMSSADGSADDSVALMTIHAAKGLEFPVVFMVGLEDGILPHSRVHEAGNEELEEERRLCYVGMTRAREELYISYATSRLQFGQRGYNAPSRFLEDMGGHISQEPLSIHERDDTSHMMSLEVSQRVKSSQFGEGEIIDVDGLAVTVRFDNGSIKKLNTEYARLMPI